MTMKTNEILQFVQVLRFVVVALLFLLYFVLLVAYMWETALEFNKV